jgi:hypothetical protein
MTKTRLAVTGYVEAIPEAAREVLEPELRKLGSGSLKLHYVTVTVPRRVTKLKEAIRGITSFSTGVATTMGKNHAEMQPESPTIKLAMTIAGDLVDAVYYPKAGYSDLQPEMAQVLLGGLVYEPLYGVMFGRTFTPSKVCSEG